MTDERWTKIWEAFTGDPMDPKNNTEAGLRRVVELLDGAPAPETNVTVKLKPLEWKDRSDTEYAVHWRAVSPAGFGYIARAIRRCDQIMCDGRYFTSMAEVRAYAQDDYTKRVFACLGETPAPATRALGINEK